MDGPCKAVRCRYRSHDNSDYFLEGRVFFM